VLRDTPKLNFPIPRDVVFTKINPETGDKANFAAPGSRFEVFMENFDEEVYEDELESGLANIEPAEDNTF